MRREGAVAKSVGSRKRRGRGLIEVKVLPKDPLVARTQNLWPIKINLKCKASDGPTSARIAVVDYNADLDTQFAPAKLLQNGSGFLGIAGLSNNRILDNFNFHQVSFPKIPSGGDSRGEAESGHHLARCSGCSTCLGRSSPTCSSRNAGLKSRTSFSDISSILH
jgi:hypothetical protein